MLEKELRAVSVNLKALEINEERSLQRENSYADIIRSLENRVKEVIESEFGSSINFGFYSFRFASLAFILLRWRAFRGYVRSRGGDFISTFSLRLGV